MFKLSMYGFNTQPPEGGWPKLAERKHHVSSFNTQPPEGGWVGLGSCLFGFSVSTHSRPKAAGRVRTVQFVQPVFVSTHSRPKAAGFAFGLFGERWNVSTHSRPKAAGDDDVIPP